MVDVRFDNGAGAGGAGGAEGGCGFRIGTGSGFGSGGDIIPRHDCDSMLVVGWVGDTTSSTTTKIAFLMLAYRPKRTLASTYDLLIRFSDSRVLSPVCCLESCDLDTDSYRDGSRRQLRLWRKSTDINLMFGGYMCLIGWDIK